MDGVDDAGQAWCSVDGVRRPGSVLGIAVAVRLSICASVRMYWGATTAIFVERFAREFSASVPRDFVVIAMMDGPLSQFVAYVLQQILHHLLVLFGVFFG